MQNSCIFLPKLTIYTDGACSGNPGPGGWGALLQFNEVYAKLEPDDLKNWNNKQILRKLELQQIADNSADLYQDKMVKEKNISGHELDTTNNRMEMSAVIEALKTLKKPCYIELYTDSKYLQLGITQWINSWVKNNWQKNNSDPVKNVDLWKILYIGISKHYIIWNWVKGHSNNEGNQIADKLAGQGKETAIKVLKCRS